MNDGNNLISAQPYRITNEGTVSLDCVHGQAGREAARKNPRKRRDIAEPLATQPFCLGKIAPCHV